MSAEPLTAPSPSAPISPEDRERLLQAIVDLCESAGGARSERAKLHLETVFLGLLAAAEDGARVRVAARLADAAWAPRGLIRSLSVDQISIARPVIARSPVLRDPDLVDVLAAATMEHHMEVARRPAIGEAVVAAILEEADPVVLTALAGNATAEIDGQSMSRLVALSERIAAIRGPLSRHPRLTNELATTLYGMVGRALRAQIAVRYTLNPIALDAALSAVVADAAGIVVPPAPGVSPQTAPAPETVSAPGGEDADARLIAKMQAAGELRPGFLLRALRQGKLDLFLTALAALSGASLQEVRMSVNKSTPQSLALLCGIVGIDRSVFPTILSFVRALNASKPSASADDLKQSMAAVAGRQPGEMMVMFKRLIAQGV